MLRRGRPKRRTPQRVVSTAPTPYKAENQRLILNQLAEQLRKIGELEQKRAQQQEMKEHQIQLQHQHLQQDLQQHQQHQLKKQQQHIQQQQHQQKLRNLAKQLQNIGAKKYQHQHQQQEQPQQPQQSIRSREMSTRKIKRILQIQAKKFDDEE